MKDKIRESVQSFDDNNSQKISCTVACLLITAEVIQALQQGSGRFQEIKFDVILVLPSLNSIESNGELRRPCTA